MSRLHVYVKAASELAAEGAEVTLASVRDRVGRGSFSTISDALCLWRAGLTLSSATPGVVPERMQEMLREMWVAAHAEAESRLFADRAALAATRAQVEQVRDALAQEADKLLEEVERLRAELAAAAAERDAANVLSQQSLAAADELRRALSERLSGGANLRHIDAVSSDPAPF